MGNCLNSVISYWVWPVAIINNIADGCIGANGIRVVIPAKIATGTPSGNRGRIAIAQLRTYLSAQSEHRELNWWTYQARESAVLSCGCLWRQRWYRSGRKQTQHNLIVHTLTALFVALLTKYDCLYIKSRTYDWHCLPSFDKRKYLKRSQNPYSR